MLSASQDQINDVALRHTVKTSERFQRLFELYKSFNNLKDVPWHPFLPLMLERTACLEKICGYVFYPLDRDGIIIWYTEIK